MRQTTLMMIGLAALHGLCSCATLAAPAVPAPSALDRYDARLRGYADLTYDGLLRALDVPPAPRDGLSFSPRKDAAYFDVVAKGLGMDEAAQDALDKRGLVLVEPQRVYSMATALYEIYTSDLPLFFTADAALDALHRSFEAAVIDLEIYLLWPTTGAGLRGLRERLEAVAQVPGMAEAAADVDLYLTVALTLLGTSPLGPEEAPLPPPRLASEADVAAILAKVEALELERVEPGGGPTTLYGARRAVDWTQFTPRGHYTYGLAPYFRALMWLGRPDTGFDLEQPRQLRAAALVSLLLGQGEDGAKLMATRRLVDAIFGGTDGLTPAQLVGIMRRLKLTTPASLAGDEPIDALARALAGDEVARARTTSESVWSDPVTARKAVPPARLQVFGQRLALDGFVLSKVVFDDIIFKGVKQPRMMPSGLDVMAALGSDEAVRLLRPEVERWKYGANLAALQEVVAAPDPAAWDASVASRWLGALRALSAPPAGRHVPEVMRTQAWARKALQTQLASWSQLRHDTVLYTQQSYARSVGCSYPEVYVEPSPALYDALARVAQAASGSLRELALGGPGPPEVARHQVAFFSRFAAVMSKLSGLAAKELAATPFTPEERAWLKRTIRRDGDLGGSGPAPTWDGWYLDLLYPSWQDGLSDNRPDSDFDWAPTVADVHTDPNAGQTLQVATGRVELAVVAIDNDGDRAIYVGPTSTYYEFIQPVSARMTDGTWTQALVSRKAPPRPPWILPYTATTRIP